MVILPLALQGMTLLLNVKLPTLDKYNSELFTWLHLTSETLTWDPSSANYREQDNAMTDYSGDIVSNAAMRGHVDSLVINPLSSLSSDITDITNDNNFYWVLNSHIQISNMETSLNGHI